jgi:peptidoglycan/xylan/chitin deacetylase (PgdA/CDA1 family)
MVFIGTRFVFAALCVLSAAPLMTLFVAPQWWRWLVLLHLPPQLALIYSCVRPNCAWFGPVVTAFQTSRKEVWLTFDDGVCADQTPRILDMLDRFQARAAFFAIGRNIAAHPALAREVIRRGHAIENHSATHPEGAFWAALPNAASREIIGGAEAIAMAIGTQSRLFRAPVGMANYFAHAVLRRQGWQLVGWSARGYDSCRNDADKIVETIYRDIRPGAIILLHEQSCLTKTNKLGISVLELLLARLDRDGFRCVVPESRDLIQNAAFRGSI